MFAPKQPVSNRLTFSTSPPWAGGHSTTVSIPVKNVEPRPVKGRGKAKKKDAPRFLLVGFDTEYQSIDAVDKEHIKGANNEVLSYQFWVKIIDEDPQAALPESSCLLIPDSDGQRITMAEFFVAAIGTFSKEHPGERLPSDVILIGHFTRADLPAFSDFKENAAEFFSNVRNTFVTLKSEQRVDIVDDDTGEVVTFAVTLRDTLLLAPANAKSLSDIGEIVGLPKLALADTKEEEQRIKEDMKAYRQDHWETFREYAVRDAQVCVRYAEKVIRQYQAMFGLFRMPLTLSQFGASKVMQDWEGRGWKAGTILGCESIKERKWNKKLSHYVTSTKRVYVDPAYFEVEFVSETYHGGRNEQFCFGICEEGVWRDHDLSSAYPTAMSLIGMPDWSTVEHLNTLDEISCDDLAYASVDFEFPDHVRFPTLPVRTEGGIIFPRCGRSYCAAPELWLAKKLGAKLTLRRGVKVTHDRQTPVFKDFIQECIKHRAQHEKGTFENLFWKEVGNSTYGKTAQGLREKRVFDLRDDMVRLPESKLTQPFFASFITSFVRAVLGEVLNRFPPEGQVFSVTTDGFLSNVDDKGIELATAGELFATFAQARKALDPTSQPLEVKHQIAQPLGWRTRGSATLKNLGDGEPVLQKGGIKTNRLFDAAQNNSYIVNLFLNRTPETPEEYETGLGWKAMWKADADFVFRSTTKRLSMEFDWKRVPSTVLQRHAHFEGQEVSHLSFDTKPLENMDEFNSLRAAWDRYDSRSKSVLKTVSDFDSFWEYWKLGKLPALVSRYMATQNGAMKRLRRDLTRAFGKHAVGFDLVRNRIPKLNNVQFTQILNECGIPCSVSDVENGKRAEFVPFQTPQNEATGLALSMLKERYFEELEIDEFFAKGP